MGIRTFLRDILWPLAYLSLRQKPPWKGRALGGEQRLRSAEGWAGVIQHPAYPKN